MFHVEKIDFPHFVSFLFYFSFPFFFSSALLLAFASILVVRMCVYLISFHNIPMNLHTNCLASFVLSKQKEKEKKTTIRVKIKGSNNKCRNEDERSASKRDGICVKKSLLSQVTLQCLMCSRRGIFFSTFVFSVLFSFRF